MKKFFLRFFAILLCAASLSAAAVFPASAALQQYGDRDFTEITKLPETSGCYSSQGMAVKVDVETGCVVGNALNGENQEFTHHPVTGVKFDGFRIPCFQQAKDLVLKASLESDKILVVGWDVAISEDGPVVVEGNRRPGLGIVQQVEGRGRMDIVRDITYRAKTAPEDRK